MGWTAKEIIMIKIKKDNSIFTERYRIFDPDKKMIYVDNWTTNSLPEAVWNYFINDISPDVETNIKTLINSGYTIVHDRV